MLAVGIGLGLGLVVVVGVEIGCVAVVGLGCVGAVVVTVAGAVVVEGEIGCVVMVGVACAVGGHIMVKRIRIPLIDQTVYLHAGMSEWAEYATIAARLGYQVQAGERGSVAGQSLWVSKASDTSTLLHELGHLVDNVMDHVGSADREFRCYVKEYVESRALAWAQEIPIRRG